MGTRCVDRVAAMLVLGLCGITGCGGNADVKGDAGEDSVANAVMDGGHDASTQGEAGPEGAQKEAPCDTTWAAIQKTILAGRGCAQDACHDSSEPTGMLDLSPEVAYANLVNVESQADVEMPRITPGDEKLSLLYLKLEAKANGTALPAAAGSPMPTAGNAVSPEELSALRLWIRAGAPEATVVNGTQTLLGCKLPESADPNKVVPPPVPAPDEGFQHYAGPWPLKADSENEVCFATYYDLTEVAPDWAKTDCTIGEVEQTCLAYHKRQLTQDAQSHHSVVFTYGGTVGPDDPAWGGWQCAGGDSAGTTCDPTQPNLPARDGGGDCGARAKCQTVLSDKRACTGFGPPDFATTRHLAGGAQTPVSTLNYPDGVYNIVPIKGMVVWNSHAFNLTTRDTTVEQYNNFWYARPENRKYPVQAIFDIRYVFSMSVPPFESREYCATIGVPQYARVSLLTSHVHKRGVLFRAWMPPNEPECQPPDCKPNEGEPLYVSRVYNDPTFMEFEPLLMFDAPEPENRTFKYCAVFDNGAADPSTVRRATGLPEGASACEPTHCFGGPEQGKACTADDDCAGDGRCDACTLVGGFTTEDEMLEFQGAYFVQPPTDAP